MIDNNLFAGFHKLENLIKLKYLYYELYKPHLEMSQALHVPKVGVSWARYPDKAHPFNFVFMIN